MAESVQTGGVIKFDYTHPLNRKLDNERKKAIEDAYAVADEREKKEKRNRKIWWILLALLIILIIGYFLIKK